jgi:hypothetical protein
MEVLTRILAAAAVLSAAGCSFLREPTPVEAMGERPSVHALLVTGDDTARVLLQRVGRGNPGTGEPVAARPVSGADVRLLSGAEAVRLAEAPAGFAGCTVPSPGSTRPAGQAGCYAAVLPGGVRAGAAYELRIGGAGTGSIEGRTVALAPLQVEAPTSLRVGTLGYQGEQEPARLPVRLRGAEGGNHVSVELLPRVVYSRGQAHTRFNCSLVYPSFQLLPRGADDRVELGVYGARCFLPPVAGQQPDPQFRTDSVRAVLRVTVFDAAFARYAALESGDALKASDATQGVTGALGLFASASRAEREVVLIPCGPGQGCTL